MAENEKLNEVLKMSDEELFAKLQEHGFSVGPIVDSTRTIYQKKLIQILEGGYVAAPDYSDSDDGGGKFSDTAQISDHEQSMRHRSNQPSPSQNTSFSPSSSFEYSGSPYGVSSRPSLSSVSGREEAAHSPLSKSSSSSASQQRTSESSVSPFSMTKLIAVGVVAIVLAFLFYYNMESNQDSDLIPKTTKK